MSVEDDVLGPILRPRPTGSQPAQPRQDLPAQPGLLNASPAVVRQEPPPLPPSLEPPPGGPPQSQFHLQGLVWWTVIVVVLVLVISWFFGPQILSLTRGADAPLANTQVLALAAAEPANYNNSYFILQNITDPVFNSGMAENFADMYTNYDQPPVWDDQAVSQALAANQADLQLFDLATRQPAFQIPQFEDPTMVSGQTPAQDFTAWNHTAELQAIDALELARNGQLPQGFQKALELDQLGGKILNSNINADGGLFAMRLQQLGSETVLQLLPLATTTPAVLQQTIRDLLAATNNESGYQNIFKFQYNVEVNDLSQLKPNANSVADELVQAGQLNSVFAEHAQDRYYLKPHETQNLFTAQWQQYVKAVGSTCAVTGPKSSPSVTTYNPFLWMFQENAIGRAYFASAADQSTTVLTQSCFTDLINEVAITELGLEQYKDLTGSLPDSLSRLSPSILPLTPVDPFKQQLLGYDPQKKILYSVGPSGQDKGGSTGTDWMTMQNPTFPINSP